MAAWQWQCSSRRPGRRRPRLRRKGEARTEPNRIEPNRTAGSLPGHLAVDSQRTLRGSIRGGAGNGERNLSTLVQEESATSTLMGAGLPPRSGEIGLRPLFFFFNTFPVCISITVPFFRTPFLKAPSSGEAMAVQTETTAPFRVLTVGGGIAGLAAVSHP